LKYHRGLNLILFLFAYCSFIAGQAKIIPLAPGNIVEPGSAIFSNEVNFKWNSIENAESYSLYISKKVNGQYNLIFKSSEDSKLIDTIYQLSSQIFKPNEQYRWNIRVSLNDGTDIYSERLYFYLEDLQSVGKPIALFPGNSNVPGNVIGNLTPRFIWTNAKNAIHYELSVSELTPEAEREIFNSKELTQVNDTAFMIPDGKLEYGKNYKWHVVAYKDDLTNKSRPLYFNTKLFTKPEAPRNITITLPENYSFENATISWQKVENARGYGLRIINYLGDKTETVLNSEEDGLLRDTVFTIPESLLNNNGTYSLQIRAYGRAGWSDLSEPYIFGEAREVTKITPITISPGVLNRNGSVIEPKQKNFKWNKVPGADGYGFYLSKKTQNNNYKLLLSF
jgi:hypothetical protein